MKFEETHYKNGSVCYNIVEDGIPFVTEATVSPIGGHKYEWIIEMAKEIYGNNIPTKMLYFHSFGTNKSLQGRGYGRKMLQHVKEMHHNCIITLCVSKGCWGNLSDRQLVEFYQSEGFVLLDRAKAGEYCMFPTMVIKL
jgi:GNAT superfamily N-acetyltransferase